MTVEKESDTGDILSKRDTISIIENTDIISFSLLHTGVVAAWRPVAPELSI